MPCSSAAELAAVFQQHSERDVLSSQRKRADYRQRTGISETTFSHYSSDDDNSRRQEVGRVL